MVRVKAGPRARKRHKKIIRAAKGYRGTRRKLYKRAHEAYLRAGQHAYAGRRLRKRNMRRLWIQRINAALAESDLSYSEPSKTGEEQGYRRRRCSYSRFMKLLKEGKIELNRKILAQLALEDPKSFKKIAEKVLKKREPKEK